MMRIGYKLNLKGIPPEKIKEVQRYIDSEVIRRSDPYAPFDTGTLIDSGENGTRIGTGVIEYTVPYAKFQYFKGKSRGQRGRKWVRRMWVANRKDILKNAKRIAKDR